MNRPTRTETETRGPDEYEDLDPGGTDFHPNRWGQAVSQKQLRERGFVGVASATATRCHCGRPQSPSTGTCNQGHEWPHPEP